MHRVAAGGPAGCQAAQRRCFVATSLHLEGKSAQQRSCVHEHEHLQQTKKKNGLGRHHSVRVQASSTRLRATPVTPARTAPSSSFKVQLLQLDEPSEGAPACTKLMVYLPGTDGTGQSILPQLPSLRAAGFDVWSLYTPPCDRSDWEELTTQATLLLRQLAAQWPGKVAAAASRAANGNGNDVHAVEPADGAFAPARITLVGESFGGCLALRLAASAAGPQLIDRMVLINPATSFNRSLNGLPALVAATNLLTLFPKDLYAVAQATLLPLLVARDRVGPDAAALMEAMVQMTPPASKQGYAFNGDTPPPGLLYAPAQASSFRANLLRTGELPLSVLRSVATPTLLLCSAKDRLLPSIGEGARLLAALPNSRRIILPDSGHAALLETGIDLAALMQRGGFAGDTVQLIQQVPRKPSNADPSRASSNSRNGGGGGGGGGSSSSRNGTGGGSGGDSGSSSDPSQQGALGPTAAATAVAAGPTHAPPALTAHADVAPSAFDATSSSSNWSTTGSTPPEPGAGSAGKESAGSDQPQPLRGFDPQALAAVALRARAMAIAAGAPIRDAKPSSRGSSSSNHGGEPSSSSSSGNGKDHANGDGQEELPVSPFDEWCETLAPWRDLVSPVVIDADLLPAPGSPLFERPMLFVGNHQKMGFYDTPLLVLEMYLRGYELRGLAHPGHWAGPFGKFFEKFGAVKASPMSAYKLLKAGEKVLLFPGGAREVAKRRGEEYTLIWKDSPDFVRLAAKCGALIVPFAAVGADDAYDVIMDADEVATHPVFGRMLGALLDQVDRETGIRMKPEETVFPLTRLPGVGLPTPIPIPNLQRLYFKFAEPIDPAAMGFNIKDAGQSQALYDTVKATITQCMAELLEVRASDAENDVGPRLSRALASWLPVMQQNVAAVTTAASMQPAAPSSWPLREDVPSSDE